MRKKKFFTKVLIFSFIFCSIFSGVCMAIEPRSEVKYQGIDVSGWQGNINFEEVKNSGIEIVYIKSSQGSNFVDPYFERNYRGAKEAGLKVGVYHFITARNIDQANIEATFFSNLVKDKSIDCKLAMDFEVFGDLSNREVNEISNAFLESVKSQTGKDMIIYSDLYNSARTFSKELAEEYPVWIAFYGDYNEIKNIPTNWEYFEGIQYMNKGTIPGIDGYVDRDYFTEEILLTEVPEYIPPKDENTNANEITYIVEKGDTLSEIAVKYDTTVKEIASLNGIQNPNLIYPKEELKIIKNTNIDDTCNHLGHVEYKIKPGNTLSEIAAEYNTTVNEIAELNHIQNVDLIYAGETIRIKM